MESPSERPRKRHRTDVKKDQVARFDTMYILHLYCCIAFRCFQLVSDLMLAGMQMLQPLRGFQQMASRPRTVCSSLQHILYLISVKISVKPCKPSGSGRPSTKQAASKGEDASPQIYFRVVSGKIVVQRLQICTCSSAMWGMACYTLEDLESVEFTWTIIDGQLLVACLQIAVASPGDFALNSVHFCPERHWMDSFLPILADHWYSELWEQMPAACSMPTTLPISRELSWQSAWLDMWSNTVWRPETELVGVWRISCQDGSGRLGQFGSLVDFSEAQSLRAELNKRIGKYMKPETPAAEARHANRFNKNQ